jgi:hypothetical protein
VRRRRRWLAVLFAACMPALAPISAQALTVEHVWRVNVDGDRHLEQVRIVRAGGDAGLPQYHLDLVDSVHGRRVVVHLSPPVDSMSASDVIIRDLNNLPRRKEIFYQGTRGTAGGPTYAGIVGWDGGWLHHFWTLAPPYRSFIHKGRRAAAGEAEARPMQLPSGHERAWELRLAQGRYAGAESVCCPRFTLTRRYRYDAARRRWVVYGWWWRRNNWKAMA